MHEHLRGYGKLGKPLAALAQHCESLCLTCECCLDQQSQPGGKRREHNTVWGFALPFPASVHAHGLQSDLCHVPTLKRWI